jgi:diaminohydroxyphosphoribosylaminopyrimidine deaminase/5-amino-6-(5-phosphoribosylamino)uracil reductase
MNDKDKKTITTKYKKQYDFFMQRCISLATKGKGYVAPNPMVGAVIVHNNKIIGEGYHKKYGEAHAEVNAINSVKDKSLLKESTIYVSLEPCAHFGKTPPCSDLIIHHKIPNVIIGMQDPFSKVNGLGIKKMKSAGCNVTVGVLEDSCLALNKEFITFHKKKRPFVILKWAETLDGLIDKEHNNSDNQNINWITNDTCKSIVHKWRAEVDAIMIGTNTAIFDNPKLNIRSWVGNNPIRIIIDKTLKLQKDLNVFDKTQPTIILNELKNDTTEDNLEYCKLEFNENFILNLMDLLYKKNIISLFVEGGEKLLTSFIKENIWDEARVFTGNINFKKGVKAPIIKGEIISNEQIDTNNLSIIKNINC